MRRDVPRSLPLPWLALLAAVLTFFGANAGRNWDFTVDDAGISYSYARNLWDGYGLVLTPGAERVEAATNFLWVLLLSPASALGVSHELLSKILGLSFASLSLAAIAIFPSVAYRRPPRYFDLVAPLCAATFAHNALWTVSGLENGLFQFLAAVSVVLLAWEEQSSSRLPWSSLTLGLLFATRPDGALYAGAIGLAKLLRAGTSRPRRQDLAWAIILGAFVASLELFRLAYFAWPFPNSFYTKKRTFEFGKDLTSFDSAGWAYVRQFVRTYKLERAAAVVPALALACRAPTARIALLFSLVAGVFLPVYSHGDWMEEWRFLTFPLPLFTLGVAEASRAVARLPLALSPRVARTVVSVALTGVVGYLVIAETTRAYPSRFAALRSHSTLEFSVVRGRAKYFAAAARVLGVHNGSVVDPDVGGMSYDSGLQVIDLFGLGDVAVARTHPIDEPGLRETLFGERRPTFVHLHGAWYAAVMLERLEELDGLYLRLPGTIGSHHDDGSNYVRRDVLAAPWSETAETPAPLSTVPAVRVDGYTVSARGIDPGEQLFVELSLAGRGQDYGHLVAIPKGTGTRTSAAVTVAGGLFGAGAFLEGERPIGRVRLVLAAGHYELRWKNGDVEIPLGTVKVSQGAGPAFSRDARARIETLVREKRLREARQIALSLRLAARERIVDTDVSEALGVYSRALANRALRLGEIGLFRLAAQTAEEAQRFAGDDAHARSLVQRLAERLADASREAERAGTTAVAFDLARDAVALDPRRSWMRRRAEELRSRRRNKYDGGRELAGYRFAASALMGATGATGATAQAAPLDEAAVFLFTLGREVEAVGMFDRARRNPESPWARVTLARGHLVRGEVSVARELLATVPCATARDPEVNRALEVIDGVRPRGGESGCTDGVTRTTGPGWLTGPAPFDALEGSFESGTWRGWVATGTAFGRGPIHDTPSNQTFVNGWRGQRYASSYATNHDAATGLLRSRVFTVGAEAMSFLIAGGSDEAHVGVRLVVNGETVLRQAGNDTEGFRRVFWDLRPFRGRNAVIEVYDDAPGAWGHVMADDFLLEPAMPTTTMH